MNDHKPSVDIYLYGLAVILAFAIRLINLGIPNLNDFEAGFALQALRFSQGAHNLAVTQPAYVQLTGLFFNLFGTSNLLARLWPALFGSLIVLAPIILRSRLGRLASISLLTRAWLLYQGRQAARSLL